MEQEDTSCRGTLALSKHDDVSDDEVSSILWDGNTVDDMSNGPTGPVTCSKSKGQNLTAKCFVILSQGANCLPTVGRMFPASSEDLKTIM